MKHFYLPMRTVGCTTDPVAASLFLPRIVIDTSLGAGPP